MWMLLLTKINMLISTRQAKAVRLKMQCYRAFHSTDELYMIHDFVTYCRLTAQSHVMKTTALVREIARSNDKEHAIMERVHKALVLHDPIRVLVTPTIDSFYSQGTL